MINRIEDLLPRPPRSAGTVAGQVSEARQRLDLQELLGKVGKFVSRNPATCLAVAFGLGVAFACLTKRK